MKNDVLVQFEKVSKSFGNLVVLDNFTFEFLEGDTHVICGRSGAGKSTLIRTINYLEPIDEGTIYFRDIEVNAKFARTVRKQVGMVFQEFNLFPHLTALENATVGPVKALNRPKEGVREQVKQLLDRVGLEDKFDSMPADLSGGERQRTSIVRALAMDPDLILFDEPTTSLDPELVDEVLEVMKGIAEHGRSMIVVSHQMGFAKECADKISFMADGKFVETKPPAEMFENPEKEATKRFLENVLTT